MGKLNNTGKPNTLPIHLLQRLHHHLSKHFKIGGFIQEGIGF